MSMGKPTKIFAKDNPEVALKVTKGHFSSDRFHINYYIDMTSLKMRRKDAQEVAKAMVSRYVSRVNLPVGNISLATGDMQQLMASLATKTPIDTIICMDGCEVIGAYVASELSSIGVTTLNSHHTSYIITPEFDSTGQMVVRDNIRPMLKDKHVLVIGGGDTGNDCVGTAIRHGCASVIQLEMMPKLPNERTQDNTWPEWPRICKFGVWRVRSARLPAFRSERL